MINGKEMAPAGVRPVVGRFAPYAQRTAASWKPVLLPAGLAFGKIFGRQDGAAHGGPGSCAFPWGNIARRWAGSPLSGPGLGRRGNLWWGHIRPL